MEAQKETRIMYILDERGELREIEREKAVPVEHPIKYRIKNAFEVFVQVKDTNDYWVSNYGRCVSNSGRKKDDYYLLKNNVPNFIFFTDKEILVDNETVVEREKKIISPSRLVAETFLKSYPGRDRVWHKDGNSHNNWYKNLIMVSWRDYKRLFDNKITLEELELEQEYIEYENKASAEAMKIYGMVKARCKETKDNPNIHKCYDDVTMCKEWWDDPKSFIKWYLSNYYEVDGETMSLDKDLFGNGRKIYSPETCCIMPQTLNVLLVNCKKHYYKTSDNMLPLGVKRSTNGGFHGEITLAGTDNIVRLSEWSTPEDAFAEYKVFKKADVIQVIWKYRDKIPRYIYEKLLDLEIEPY